MLRLFNRYLFSYADIKNFVTEIYAAEKIFIQQRLIRIFDFTRLF